MLLWAGLRGSPGMREAAGPADVLPAPTWGLWAPRAHSFGLCGVRGPAPWAEDEPPRAVTRVFPDIKLLPGPVAFFVPTGRGVTVPGEVIAANVRLKPVIRRVLQPQPEMGSDHRSPAREFPQSRGQAHSGWGVRDAQRGKQTRTGCDPQTCCDGRKAVHPLPSSHVFLERAHGTGCERHGGVATPATCPHLQG